MSEPTAMRDGGDQRLAATLVAGWFDRHVDSIHAYAARRVGADVARDVVADTFRIALERFGSFDSALGNERAWLFGIATNVLHRYWRVEERRLRTQARSAASDVAPDDPLLQVDGDLDAARRFDRLVDAVARLAPEDRDLLTLTAWEEMSSAEVSAVLGIPSGTVRSRLLRIRSQLRSEEGNTNHD